MSEAVRLFPLIEQVNVDHQPVITRPAMRRCPPINYDAWQENGPPPLLRSPTAVRFDGSGCFR